ncbi:hypothetical protein [Tardiphaga sp. 709]|uniref:hypothetical protein n=1 Tax=Tardiphaga sp. 709 TaxID=3076039 RepID=UPI0028F077D2|nr:hypothetical protein [Tardiphaga sp. 709]WNV09652.1 hypothetical protein RSO67_00155 [Tardiphaga sp. 709]
MSGVSEPPQLRIITLRAQIAELGAAIRLLRQAGMDNAAAELLLARKRAELDGMLWQGRSARSDPPTGEV